MRDGAAKSNVSEGGNDAPVVSILVISFNTIEMTLACLRSVVEETRTPLELIVVDNASADGSAEAIAAAFPGITLIAETRNLGFARANNLAALRAKGEYLLLLNPDTVVQNRAIDNLVEFARRRPDAGIWGGRTLFGDGTLNPSSCWRRMTLWALICRASGLTAVFSQSDLFNPEAYGGWSRKSERRVDVVSGCFFLLPRKLWQALNGFDPSFEMYGEEADLCLRARAYGADPAMTPKAEIIHYGGASETVRADKMVRLLTAKMTLISRHFQPWQRPLAQLLFRFWPLSRMLAHWVLIRLGYGRVDEALVWSSVWRRRSEWQDGYTGR